MKIAIITPSFNSVNYIDRAIQSVLNQDYDNWEHIIIDGGSIDGTIDILKKYDHLKWISEPDKGVYHAMNKGLEMATGEIIYFLGCDDVIYDERVFTDVIKYFEDFDIIYGDVISDHFKGRYGGEFKSNDFLHKNICHQSIFFKKNVFEIIGNFNVKYKIYADWDHNLKWFLNNKLKSQYYNRIICTYGSSGFSSKNIDFIFVNERCRKFLEYGFNILPKEKKLFLSKKNLKFHLQNKNYNYIFKDLYYFFKSYILK